MLRKTGFSALLLLFLAFFRPALAYDAATLDIASCQYLETDRSYVRITCPLQDYEDVLITILDAGGSPVYQRSYADRDGLFRSDDIYLRLDGTQTRYRARVECTSGVYEADIVRLVERLENNTACTAGLSLGNLTGKSSWLSCTVLDLAALREHPETWPVRASNRYALGSVTFTLSDGRLTASFSAPEGAQCRLSASSVEIALTAVDAQALGTKRFHGVRTSLDTPSDVDGASYVAILVQLTVSYDTGGLSECPPSDAAGQAARWESMQHATEAESNG